MSYSLLSIKRREIFDTKNYKTVLKYVYYYGKPNNNRQEYFAAEHLILNWIRKTIYWNMSINYVLDKKNSYCGEKAKFSPGVIALDYIVIFWEISFHVDNEKCWFVGPVLINKNKIQLKSKSFNIVIIYSEEVDDDEIYELKVIKFVGPPPCLKSMITKGDTTYLLNVKWDNSYSKDLGIIRDFELIKIDKYKILVGDRAIILPN